MIHAIRKLRGSTAALMAAAMMAVPMLGCGSETQAAQDDQMLTQGAACRAARIEGESTCRASDGKFAKASCCEQQERGRCMFGQETFSLLEPEVDAIAFGEIVTLSATSPLTSLQKKQIVKGVRLNGVFEGDSPAAVFDYVDSGEVDVRSMVHKATGAKYTGYEYSAGDTPVAFVFRKGTTDVVMLAGDGDIERCSESK